MKELRIVFMGTPEFAVPSLEKILEAGYNVVGVITAPDRPAGRGRKLHPSAVKKYAIDKGLKLMQPVNLKADEFILELSALQANVQVVVAFRMLPQIVWAMPELGTFNLHASLLPQYRGAAPINWAIINGELKTGVSTFFIDEKIDTGNMILQKEIKILPEENAGQLHDKLMESGAVLITDTLALIQEEKVSTTPQKENNALKPAPKLNKENTRINWEDTIENIHNLIRGLSPYPAAWTVLLNNTQEMNVKIYSSKKVKEQHKLSKGRIICDDKQVKVAVPEGFLIIKEIQLPGKRKMKTKELLNGFSFASNAKFL